MGFWSVEEGHWHLGYYEGKYCIEAIGFRNEEGTWDVFFNHLDDEDVQKLFGSAYELDNDFGVLIFKTKDYEEAQIKFSIWVETILVPFLNNK